MAKPSPEFPLDTPLSKTFYEALRGMADRPFLTSQTYQTQQWKAVVDGAHPDILEFKRVLVKRMAKLGVPMYAHSVVRTFQEQMNLFRDGHSKDSPADGLWPHNCGACDLVHSTKHWNLDKRQWALCGHVGKEVAAALGIDVTWGGDWKFYDPAHWELTNWRDLAAGYPWPL